MVSLSEILTKIDGSADEMVRVMTEMIRIPALAPVNGGDGESKKADYLQSELVGFDSIVRVDVPDDVDPSVMRSNILAKKNGRKPGTVWIIAHMDVVPAGDSEMWDNPPFEPVFKDGKIYGRGTEDNGQSIISSMFASKFFESGELDGMSIGVAYVADEETTSKMGIEYLLDHGYFSEDDFIMVPDWGSPNGSMVEVAEKNVLWLRFEVEGKTTHGSTPDEGINAFRVSTLLLTDLMKVFEERFSMEDPLFLPPRSTFEPTKRPSTVDNINTIPGYDEFSMDIRLLPSYSIEDVIAVAEEISSKHAERTGARIKVVEVQRHTSGKPSSIDTERFHVMCESVESITGNIPRAIGVGGGTCANFFRERGFDAYVWQCGGGTLHAPNEYALLDNIMVDAKVFATIYYRLCR